MTSPINEKEHLHLIKNAMIDARFVLDDANPCNGIWKVLLSWEIPYFLIAAIIYIISDALQSNLDLPNIDTYFSLLRLLTIFLYLIPIITYIIALYKTNMTLKESSFLKNLIYFPIIIYIIKILFPLSYYLNTEALLILYDTFPLDIIFLIIALIQFFLYFKNKTYILLILLSSVFAIFYLVIKLINFHSREITSLVYLQINNILDFININSIFLLIIIFVTIFIVKRDSSEN